MLRPIYVPQLNVLRFFSFFLVYLYHSYYSVNPFVRQADGYGLLERLLAHAHHATDFFFVLSAFLFVWQGQWEEEQEGGLAFGAFYKRRFLRTLPPYGIVLVCCFLLLPILLGQTSGNRLWPYLLMIGNFELLWNGPPSFAALWSMWTLNIHEQFYLLAPLVFLVRSSWRMLMWGLLGIGSLLFQFQHDVYTNTYHSISIAVNFALGAWVVLWGLQGGFRRWRSWMSVAVLLALLLGYVAYDWMFYGWTAPLARLWFAGCFALLIGEQVFVDRPLLRLSRWPLLASLGRYTYGMYIYHLLVLLVVQGILRKIAGYDSFELQLLGMALGLLLTLSVSVVSYHIIERPMMRLGRSL